MDKVFSRIGSLFQHPKSYLLLLPIACCALQIGCASSNVSRTVATNVDKGIETAKNAGDNMMDGSMADSVQYSTQRTRGGVVGGTTGAVLGALTTSTGFLPGAVVGGMLGMSYGSYITSESTLKDKLENRGATVVELGDQILIVVNSARIFTHMSSKIKPQAFTMLDLVGRYINQFPQMSVKISTYTDDIGAAKVNLALSRQQAKAVEHYLSSHSLNTRVLYAQGYGPTRLVQRGYGEWGKSDNYRIEFTLEKLYT